MRGMAKLLVTIYRMINISRKENLLTDICGFQLSQESVSIQVPAFWPYWLKTKRCPGLMLLLVRLFSFFICSMVRLSYFCEIAHSVSPGWTKYTWSLGTDTGFWVEF